MSARYMDIYFDQTELDTAIADIQSDIVYRNLPVEQSSEPHQSQLRPQVLLPHLQIRSSFAGSVP